MAGMNSILPSTRWTKKDNWLVVKLGGSLLSPHETGPGLLKDGQLPLDIVYARELIKEVELAQARCVFVVGGGFLNRWYLKQIKEIELNKANYDQDLHMIGMAASDINASIFRMLIAEELENNVVYPRVVKYEDYDRLDSLKNDFSKYQVVVAAGWKPGHSHDVDALMFGSLFKEKQIYSFKNIDGIYTGDPRTDATAVKKKTLTWDEYRAIIKTSEHLPGASFPIDAVAAQLAQKIRLGVVVIDGRDLRAVREVFTEGITTRGTTVEAN
jgi:uridylate kinase